MTTRVLDVIGFSDARAHLDEVVDRVLGSGAPVVITRGAAEAAVLAPLSDWNGMQETLHLLSSPANAAHLREAMRELDDGHGPAVILDD